MKNWKLLKIIIIAVFTFFGALFGYALLPTGFSLLHSILMFTFTVGTTDAIAIGFLMTINDMENEVRGISSYDRIFCNFKN